MCNRKLLILKELQDVDKTGFQVYSVRCRDIISVFQLHVVKT